MNTTNNHKKIVSRVFNKLTRFGLLNWMNDKMFLELSFRIKVGERLNLDSPRSFNEKLQWLKLYDRNPLYTKLVDKIETKKIVASKIGNEYIIPTLRVWDRFEEINFNQLPNQFVLKCSHDSGGLSICKNKSSFNYDQARNKINKSLKRNYYWMGREWPYKDVPPRILAEQYLEDECTHELRDYKFFCFNGHVKALFVASDRGKATETRFDFFDSNYTHFPFTNGHPNASVIPQKPKHFDLMKDIASNLSQGIPHVRVDLYECNGKVYFGEMTFSHWSGLMPFVPQEWDYIFGSWIKLPSKH